MVASVSIWSDVATADLLPAGTVSVMYAVLLVPMYRENVDGEHEPGTLVLRA